MSRARLKAWTFVSVVCACTACGGSTPSSGPGGSAPTPSDYIREVLDVMQNNSLRRAQINWTEFREQVMQQAQKAQSIPALYEAISTALALLGDHHSYYRTPSGGFVRNPDGKKCQAAAAAMPAIPADVGYLRVPGYTGSGTAVDTAFADSIESEIRSRDAAGLAGWIVDLRGNTGGNMWPMVAGLGAILGEGLAGYFVTPLGGAVTPWGYQDGSSYLGTTRMVHTSAPYTLIVERPRVAVLTDNAVASSGEAVAISFRGQPNTRSFGDATCGLSTVNEGFVLSDGAILLLTTGTMADRSLTLYGETVSPDEYVPGDRSVVDAAIAWLRNPQSGQAFERSGSR